MKILLCVQVKLENSYIREWIEYHKNLGFTNIVISDNNDLDKEDPYYVINDYVDSGYVIIDYTFRNRGQGHQAGFYTNMCNKYKDDYDWIAFFDLDEFLYISTRYKTISNFLSSNELFNDYNGIGISWITYGDNGYIESSSFDIINRFDSPKNLSKDKNKNLFMKSFINCKKWKSEYYFIDAHYINDHEGEVRYCNQYGNLINICNKTDLPITTDIYIKHFITKSLNEYINQKCVRGLQWEQYSNVLDLYKDINGWCQEYENYYQFRQNNSIEIEKKILICIFYEHEEMIDIIKSSYIQHIENFHGNISYKFCHNEYDITNIYFDTYFNVFKDIYLNDNNYDAIVCVNEKVFLNIHLLNRFINIIYDKDSIYTDVIQLRGLNNNQISERMFILSKEHLETLVNSNYIKENSDCLGWYPSYTLGIIFKDIKLKDLGHIYFYDNKHQLNELTESIFTFILYKNFEIENYDKIQQAFLSLTEFINKNIFLFILRLHKIDYIHCGEYVDYIKEKSTFDELFHLAK